MRVIYAEQMFLFYLISSIDIEIIRTVFFFFYEEILNLKTQTKASKLTFNQIFLSKQKNLSNIHSNKYALKSI